MANSYIVTLGKNNYKTYEKKSDINDTISENSRVLKLKSKCYFDWIEIRSVDFSENVFSTLTSTYSEIGKMYNEEFCCNRGHMQQNIICLSDDEKNILEDVLNSPNDVTKIYFTFVNLKTDTKKLSVDIPVGISVYYTFDHYDYIIVCDGSKLKLKDYLIFLKSLKSECSFSNEVSLYGYNVSAIKNDKEEVSAIVKFNATYENSNLPKSQYNMTVLGRYDKVHVYNQISIDKLFEENCLAEDSVFSSKVYIGTDESALLDESDEKSDDYICKKLLNKSERLFDKYLHKFSKENLENKIEDYEYFNNCLFKALKELQKMICTMICRRISLYYVLCFYEAFYSVLEYIDEKIINVSDAKILEENGFVLDDLHRAMKLRMEKTIELLNSFFAHFRTLSASMLHNERKFIQTDPYQLMYFDIPPKLTVFYTAIANSMVSNLSGNKKNKYHFMIVPDFKEDIYVDSLTDNQDEEEEINILIIHVNEKCLHDIPATISVIAHEIAHHVGQDKLIRKERAILFIKSMIACIIYNIHKNVEYERNLFFFCDTSEKQLDFLGNLVEAFYNNIFLGKIYLDGNYYYIDKLIGSFINTIKNFYNQDDDSLKKQLKDVFEEVYKDVELENYISSDDPVMIKNLYSSVPANSDGEKNFSLIRKIVLNKIIDDFIVNFRTLFMEYEIKIDNSGKYSFSLFDTLVYLFREGYADTQMLLLTVDNTVGDIKRRYDELLGVSSLTDDEKLKRFSVLQSFNPESIRPVGVSKIHTAYYQYICKCATEYFKQLIAKKNVSSAHGESPVFDLHDCNTLEKLKVKIDSTIDEYIFWLSSDIF